MKRFDVINQEISKQIKLITDKIMEADMAQALKVSKGLVASVDFTWDSKRSGKAGTLTVRSPITQKNVARVHVQRTGAMKNFDGTAKAMEGRAVDLLIDLSS